LRLREGRLGGVLEAIYANGPAHHDWLEYVTAALRNLTGSGQTVVGTYRWNRRSSFADFASSISSTMPGVAEMWPDLSRHYTPERYRRVFCGRPVQTMTEALGDDQGLLSLVKTMGFPGDYVALCALDADDEGCIVALASPSATSLAGTERAVLEYLTAHLTAAHRARRHRGASEAIFSPGGNVAHAEPVAQRSLDELREMVRLSERARTKNASPAEALAAWTAIVQGRWSLVETFDSDGRRHIVARENEPRPNAAFDPKATCAAPALTAAQLSALTLLGRGYAQKAIAYELGLSPARVSRLLGAARRALGIETRAELTQIAREALAPSRPSIGARRP
jgi:DNA-binding CsgD family transcriptional regulator